MSAIRIIAFPQCQLRGAGQCVSSIKTFADVAQVECSKWRALTPRAALLVLLHFYAFSAGLQTAFWFTPEVDVGKSRIRTVENRFEI